MGTVIHMKLRNKIGYGLGDMGISINYFAVTFFFIYYLVKIVGMDPALAGTAYFIGRLWDGLNDPFMGALSDRTRSKYGRKRMYLLFGAIPFAIAFYLLWLVPQNATTTIQFIYATAAIFLYGTAYTVVTVPYMALVPVMSPDYDERTQITGLRAILSAIGSLLGGGFALLFDDTAPLANQAAYIRMVGLFFAVFSAFTLIAAALSVGNLPDDPEPDIADLRTTLRQYVDVAKDKNVSILLVLKILGAVGTGALSSSIPFFAGDVLGGVASSSIGLAIYVVFGAISIPIWNKLTISYDKRKILLYSNFLVAVVLLGIGIFVDESSQIILSVGTDPLHIPYFYVGTAFLGIFMGAYLFIPYSLVPDLVEYYEHVNNEKHESIFFGLWMMAHQIGIAFSGLIFTQLLSWYGYVEGDNVIQTESAIMGVRLSFGLLPGLFLFLAAIVLQKYGITKQVFQDILAQKGVQN